MFSRHEASIDYAIHRVPRSGINQRLGNN